VMFAHGLAKDPLDRPPTAAMFLEEVEEAARAAYGPRWETRGRNRLVEMAALLVLLFPLAEPPGRIASALGLTRLSRDKARTLAAAGVGALVIIAGASTAALRVGNDLGPPTNLAAPMFTPRPVPNGAGLGAEPSPKPTWQMPGGLPTGDWTPPPPPGTLPTTPVANPSAIGGVPPAPGSTNPGGGSTGGGSSSGGPTAPVTGGGGPTTPVDPPTTPVDPPTTPVDPPTTPVDPPTTPVDPPTPPAETTPAADPSGSGGAGLSGLLADLAEGLDIG
jgi:eukaryotic-like serine/threonine-protein kinase